MNTESANRAANAARNPNTMVYGAVFFGATLLGYYYYKRTSDASNLGDAASRTGAAAGRAVERAGESVKDEGRGLQAKKQ